MSRRTENTEWARFSKALSNRGDDADAENSEEEPAAVPLANPASPATAPARGNWNMRELVVVAALSVVFGILYLWWIPVGRLAAGLGGPLAREPVFGFWLLAAVVAGYIVQKPGAALIAELIASFMELLGGSSGGLLILGWGLVQGAGVEVVFLATRYRNFSAPVLMLG